MLVARSATPIDFRQGSLQKDIGAEDGLHALEQYNVGFVLRIANCVQLFAASPDEGQTTIPRDSRLGLSPTSSTDATLCHSFLKNTPEHHEIVATWVAHRADSAGGH
jgi:hypothetical protein